MKIFYITNARIPTERAHGIQIVNTCQGLSKIGSSVTLLLPKRVNKVDLSVGEFYGIDPSFNIVWLPTIDAVVVDRFLGSLSYYIQLLSFYISVFFYLLPDVFKRQSVVFSRDPVAVFLRGLRFPVYIEVHSIPENKKFLFFYLLRWASGLVAISEGVESGLKKYCGDLKSIVIHDAVDLGKFSVNTSKVSARGSLGLGDDSSMVLYSGHLYDWKGADVLARASTLIKGVVYFVGGAEKEISAFKTKFNDLIEAGRIVIIGPRPHAEMPLWMKSSDVLVLPTVNTGKLASSYTSPLKLFEYIASGRPVVASDLPSSRAILKEGQAVFFVQGNEKSLAEAVNKVLDDKVLADSLVEKSAEIALNNTWETRANRIHQLISQP